MNELETIAFIKARKRRNWVIALSLFAFVVLVFAVTLVKYRTGNAAGPHF